MVTTTDRVNMYEGMFLFPQTAAANLQQASDHLKEQLARAEAEIVSFKKWDERRLAYEIKGNKRGVYFLVYFKAHADNLIGLERDCNLSEQILRSMVMRADLVSEEVIEASDGAAALEDEIKVRGEDAEAAAAASTESAAAAAPAEPAAEPAAE